ncbi:hypothetical protein EMCRGX_G011474 [Ephydatia muelleri]
MYHGLEWRQNPTLQSPMCSVSSIGNVFLGDFVQFHIVGILAIGHIVQFVCQEGIEDISVKVQLLSKHPDAEKPDCYILGDMYSIFSRNILQVLPNAALWISGLYRQTENEAILQELTVQEHQEYCTPHKFKECSQGKPVYIVPLILFSDDTSGNRSKIWNKFDSWSFRLAGLPNEENSKLQNIHYICSSNKVSAIKMAAPMVEELLHLQNEGMIVYDAYFKCDVIVVPSVLCIFSDNPRASEICNHLGSTASLFCRVCMTNSSTGLDNIAEYRTKAQTLQHIQSIQQCLTETEKKHVRNLYGITEVENALLQLDVDLHRCTPLEALHVFLLGIYKYFLRDFMGCLSKREKNEIAGRIAAFNFSGFSHRLSRDITRYYRSFVGRDFKVLAQLSLFIFAPYLTASETEVWFGLSKLFKLVYCDKLYLERINEYRDACCSFVQTVQRNCPGHRKKPKLHLLMHLPEYIELFGHPSSYNTESTSAIKLKDVKIQLCSGCISISEATNFSCLFSTHEIDYNTSVLQCNAVESDDGQLINVGTFVQLKLQRTTSNEQYQLTEISLVPIYHDQACRNPVQPSVRLLRG